MLLCTTEYPVITTERSMTELPTSAPPATTTTVSPTRAPFTPPTTIRSVPTTRRTLPLPETGCALAYDPQYTIGDPEEGYRFGK